MRVLLTGDSHTGALQKGLTALRADGQWPEEIQLTICPLGGGHLTREPFFTDQGDHARITTPEYRRQFERLPLPGREEQNTVYGLSAPLHTVRIWRHPDWQNFSPSLDPTKAPVSSSLLRRVILDDQRYVLELIDILKRTGKRVFVVEAPHPFRHHPALRHTSPDLVLRLNHFYRDIIRDELAARDVPIASVPEEWLEAGFMRTVYAQPGDPHHGNALYGRQMMERVAALLADRAERSAIVPARALTPTV